MKIKLSNKILIPVVIIALIVIGAVLIITNSSHAQGDVVVIHKDGKIVKEIELSKVEEPFEIDLKTNVVYIEKDGVTMKSAKCPDKICVHQGKISEDASAIICMPNKIMVEFKGKNKEVDTVAGAR